MLSFLLPDKNTCSLFPPLLCIINPTKSSFRFDGVNDVMEVTDLGSFWQGLIKI